MSNYIPPIDNPQRISIGGKSFATIDDRSATEVMRQVSRLFGKRPQRTASIVQARRNGRIVGRNEPCPWHPASKFKRCPHDCYRNGSQDAFSKPEQSNGR